ncbi:MAG: hypothetical protein ACKO8Q_09300 [Bacteroidota bacterium]
MRIIPFRGAEKFLSTPPISEQKIKPAVSADLPVSSSEGANLKVELTAEKKLVKVGIDAEKRSIGKRDIDHVSIHEKVREDDTVSVNDAIEDKANRVYGIEEVKLAYSNYLKILENMNALSSAALSSAVFSELSSNVFELSFLSQPQIDYFNEERVALFEYYREQGIVGVQLISKLAEGEIVIKEFLTNRMRFEKMMAANPKIEEMWKRFKLVVD